jgi:uncharacterized protein (TIGR03083 family)
VPTPVDSAIATLAASHERLRALVEPLSGDQLRTPSFCDDWSIAQVLSHLGSQSEIISGMLVAARDGVEAPSTDDNPKVWARWDALAPEEQRASSLATNATELGHLQGLSEEQRADLQISLFGGMMEVDAAGYARLRLNEHTMHSWDIAVTLDPTARLAPDAVGSILDAASTLVSYMGKPQGRSFSLRLELTGPDEVRALVVGEQVAIEPWADRPVDGTLRLPAEAFVRLLYGRALDDDPWHLDSTAVTPADLRATFPGV